MDGVGGVSASDVAQRLLLPVQRVMQVYNVTSGDPAKVGFLARFRGRLLLEPTEAYDRLEPAFASQGMTLLFRSEGGDHLAIALPGRIQPRPSNPWTNLLLFLGTLFSVLLAGALYSYDGPEFTSINGMFLALLGALPQGIPFAFSLLAILGAHESGHYLAARFHKTAVTLPYFLPFPGSTFGTLGAFIQLKSPPKNRRALLDIGLAGPLAGIIVAVPVLLLGLYLSKISPLPATPAVAVGQGLEGNSVLYLAAKFVVTGRLLPEPVSYGGVSPLVYWIRYFFIGRPVPFGAADVLLHPIAWAGWAGLLVTSLNLIPAGQLDGGHLLYVLLGRRATRVVPFVIVALVALGLVWQGWWLWAVLIFFMGRGHAEPLDEITPLDGRRKLLAVLGLILFLLVFTPVPLQLMG
jgi:membrane-associated protease RseP (regulator of RpoE activity)